MSLTKSVDCLLTAWDDPNYGVSLSGEMIGES